MSTDTEAEDVGRIGSGCAGCFLVCGLCKILCFTGCKAIFPCCFEKPPQARPEYSVICVGLSGSGKSTLLSLLAGEVVPDSLEPTMGFAMKTILHSDAIFHIKELGGADNIRKYWNRYYDGHEALIFVVDSSSSGTEERDVLKACVSDPMLEHVPVLVVCNKTDLDGSRKLEEWVTGLNIKYLCEGRYYRVVASSRGNLKECQKALDGLAQELFNLPKHYDTS